MTEKTNREIIMSVHSHVEIRVYPNQLNREEYELVGCDAGITLLDYLHENVPAYRERPAPLFSVLLNDEPLVFKDWGIVKFESGDLVECIIEPKDPVTAVMVVIAVASAAYSIHLANQPLPDTYNTTSPSGSSIYDANAQGNRPRLMGIVPVLFGRHKIFADYLNPPKIVYSNNEQVLQVMLSLGHGSYDFSSSDIYIGDTKISQYGNAVNYKIFQPGENVTSHPAHLTEYRSVEVGSTSSSQGLKIKGSPYSFYYFNNGWSVKNSTELQLYNAVGYSGALFDDDYNNKTGGTLVGKTLEFLHPNGNTWGIFKLLSSRQDNTIAKFARLNSDGSIDTDWAGFQHPGNGENGVELLLYASFRIVEPVEADRYVGAFLSVPDSESTNRFMLDFRFNSGLTKLNNSGVPTSRTVTLEIQWRNEGEANWNTVLKGHTDSTVDQLAYTHEITVPSGTRPEVRVRRTTTEWSDITYKDSVDWVGLRAVLPNGTALSYPGLTTMALEIRGSNELAGSAENKISIVPTRKLKKFNSAGAMVDYGPTRSISSAVYAVADELGYDLDMDELWRLHQVWEDRGDTFDGVFDNPSTAWKAIQQILAVGFAEPTLDFGKIIPVRDEAQTVIKYPYQSDNILPNSWKMDGSFVDSSDNDGIEVEYMSSETWKPETVLCLLLGDAGDNPEKVRAYGVTNKTQAYRFGMRKRATQKHRRIRHHFSTEMDALNSRYMSYDALGIDMPGYSQTGRVENVAGRVLQLNQDLEWGDLAVTHYLGIRRPNGTLSGPYQCSPGAAPDEVVINADLDFVPVFNGSHEPPYFMFGQADEWCIPILVTEIKPTGTDRVKVTAFEYSDNVYLYDDAVPPA
jgi:hypothetical protein